MFWNKNVLFCDINPTCYAISQQKEICKRHVKNLAGHVKFARERSGEKLPVTVSSYDSGLIKRGKGIDPVLQENKAVILNLPVRRSTGSSFIQARNFLSGKLWERRPERRVTKTAA